MNQGWLRDLRHSFIRWRRGVSIRCFKDFFRLKYRGLQEGGRFKIWRKYQSTPRSFLNRQDQAGHLKKGTVNVPHKSAACCLTCVRQLVLKPQDSGSMLMKCNNAWYAFLHAFSSSKLRRDHVCNASIMFPSIRAENRQMKEEEAEGSLYRTSRSTISNFYHQLDLLPDLL